VLDSIAKFEYPIRAPIRSRSTVVLDETKERGAGGESGEKRPERPTIVPIKLPKSAFVDQVDEVDFGEYGPPFKRSCASDGAASTTSRREKCVVPAIKQRTPNATPTCA
jgi:hypothetical protein